MRILWDSWCHAHACKMPREIINCPLYPAGLGDTTESLYFFLLLCITIRSRSLFSAKQTRGEKSRWNENGWIKLCFLVFLQFTWHVFFSIKMICLRPLGILISNHLSFNLPSGHAIRFFRLSNIDASWPDIFFKMSWLKRDIAVNGSLIAKKHAHRTLVSTVLNFFSHSSIYEYGDTVAIGIRTRVLWDIGIAGGTQCKQEIMSSVGREKEKEEKTDKREIVKTEKNSCKIG